MWHTTKAVKAELVTHGRVNRVKGRVSNGYVLSLTGQLRSRRVVDFSKDVNVTTYDHENAMTKSILLFKIICQNYY